MSQDSQKARKKRWAVGNDRADMSAKMAAQSAITMETAELYVERQKNLCKKLRAIAKRLGAQVFPEIRRSARNTTRVWQRDVKHVPVHLQHTFRWQRDASKRNGVCEKCGIAKQRGRAACDKHACLGVGLLAKKHTVHTNFLLLGGSTRAHQ